MTNETTKLLSHPSACSTDGPVRVKVKYTSSNDDVEDSLAVHLQALDDVPKPVVVGSSSKKLSAKRLLERHHVILMLLFGCALSVALVSLINYRPTVSETHNLHPLPFSRIHPVDLGIMEYTRPEASFPPSGLFRRFHDNASQIKSKVLPTNAWYQNMLLVRGEPSTVHRAYAIPYLLDAVGVVPGLRINPNFLVASTNVVQLSFNELFGLTVGATGNLKNKRKKESFQYTVGETTELGITLHWVSFW